MIDSYAPPYFQAYVEETRRRRRRGRVLSNGIHTQTAWEKIEEVRLRLRLQRRRGRDRGREPSAGLEGPGRGAGSRGPLPRGIMAGMEYGRSFKALVFGIIQGSVMTWTLP